jgi:hypothetical protein
MVMKLTAAQTKLLARVQNEGRYGVQTMQKASAKVLLEKGLVIDDTKADDFCKYIKLAKGEQVK